MKLNARQAFFFLLLFAVSLLFFGIIQNFLLTCFWAAVLAIIFHGTYRYICRLFRERTNVAAAVTVSTILLVVVLPLFFIILALINESQQFYQQLQSGELDVNTLVDFVEQNLPVVEEWLQKVGLSINNIRASVSDIALNVTKILGERALSYTQNALALVVDFFLMLYLLFFFLRDGKQIVEKIVAVLPIGDKREYILLDRFASVARATLKGSLIVAAIQGTIGGLLFWLLGIKGAVFWGAIMTLLSLLPAVGSGIVWGPVAIIAFIDGNIVDGLIIVLVGVFVIGLVDNLLRPILVGRDTQMSDYMILLSTIGGIASFGLSGFVIGPCIAALFITCWEMLGEEYGGREL